MLGSPSGALAWDNAKAFELAGQIDPVVGIANQRMYLYSGKKDDIVLPRIVAATRDFYRAAGVPGTALSYVKNMPSGHAFLSPAFGKPCGTDNDPYIEHCLVRGRPYDQPQQILGQIYGALKPAATSLSATVQPFDQRFRQRRDGAGFGRLRLRAFGVHRCPQRLRGPRRLPRLPSGL